MKKRMIAWLILAVMLLTAVPAVAADKNERVETFGVEETGSGITVILPAGYAGKGYFKLFWKNDATGDIGEAVFPVDTTEYTIEAETGAEYSLQLYYAKKKGLLPARWKEDKSEEPKGPSVWNVLWIDAETVECLGVTDTMTEADHLQSEKTAGDFEALVEEFTGGLVDIAITRMTLEEPLPLLTYYQEVGYGAEPNEDFDVKHYALRTYDSVFVLGRVDGIYLKYSGIAFQPENAREDAGYSFICMYGDDILMEEYNMTYVCVHEWIHQLGYFYNTLSLEIPNPDEPEKYGYDAESGNLDPQLFRDALTMNAVTDDGRKIGVPAEAWQYKPTHTPEKWNLSYLQPQETSVSPRPKEEKPEATAAPDLDPIFGVISETGYENAVLGVSYAAEDWRFYAPGEYPFTVIEREPLEDDPDFLKNRDAVIVMYAESYEGPYCVEFAVETSSVPFMKENGAAAYAEEMKKVYEQIASESAWETVSCEIVERMIGNRSFSCLKLHHITNKIHVYEEWLYSLHDDYVFSIGVSTYMVDRCAEALEPVMLQEN